MTKTFGKVRHKRPSHTIGGEAIYNEILLGLPARERAVVLSELELVETRNRDVLNDAGVPIEYCYFLNNGVASILNVLGGGKSVEVGLTGKEGFVGLPLVVGLSTSSTRILIQIPGSAFRMGAAPLRRVLCGCPQLTIRLNRYAQELGLQATQVAACNRLHEVSQRMARWLLMTQDRIQRDVVPLTQEFLAHVLGTRRASVTVAAGILQKTGSIRYSRGSVAVLSRGKLAAAACECYAAMTRQSQNWRQEQA